MALVSGLAGFLLLAAGADAVKVKNGAYVRNPIPADAEQEIEADPSSAWLLTSRGKITGGGAFVPFTQGQKACTTAQPVLTPYPQGGETLYGVYFSPPKRIKPNRKGRFKFKIAKNSKYPGLTGTVSGRFRNQNTVNMTLKFRIKKCSSGGPYNGAGWIKDDGPFVVPDPEETAARAFGLSPLGF